MRMRWVINPSSNKPDPMLTMSVLVVTAASLKFLLEGVSTTVNGTAISFGHVDAAVYAALLTPVLGIHGYLKGKKTEQKDTPNAN